MKQIELDESLENDPLALRLSRIQGPPVPEGLMASVLSGRPAPRRRRVRRSHLLAAVAVVAALLTVVAASPLGVSARVGFLQRFGITAGTPQTLPHPGPNDCAIYKGAPNMTKTTFTRNGVTITEWTRPAPKGCGGGTLRMDTYQPPMFDLQHAQAVVSFPIRTPASLPAGLQLEGVSMDPKPPEFSTFADQATLIYRPRGKASGPNLSIKEQPGTPNGGTGAPSSSVKEVSVSGHPAVYVHGNYDQPDPNGPATWNPNGDVSELAWQANGVTFDVTASGLHLSKTDLVRVAESVQ